MAPAAAARPVSLQPMSGAGLPADEARYTFRREIRATTTREGSGQRMNSVVSPFGSMTFWYGVPA